MSVLQKQQEEVRFLRRKNLEEEARIYGNMLADQIRMFGIDCIYHKLNTDVFGNYHDIVDHNVFLRNAYKGYDLVPDYRCSAFMITYPEMQQDIFQLNKYGIIPEAEVDFHFDSKQFACDLATKCGQLKEYKINSQQICCIVNDSGLFDIGPIEYSCGILSGNLSTQVSCTATSEMQTTICDSFGHTQFGFEFPKNPDLYASLTYKVCKDDFVDSLIYLDYSIQKQLISSDYYANVLSGNIYGSILFYDLFKIGKYLDLIHPEVGDVVEIDFPDDKNREKYQITDCYDKSLQSDGISPLLHKYIWKCKAKRYVDSYEDTGLELNDSDHQLEEKIKEDMVIEEGITKKIELYDEGDQEAYGGYDGVIGQYDEMNPEKYKAEKYENLPNEEGTVIEIFTFSQGSKLVTNGYDLIFVTRPTGNNKYGDGYLVAQSYLDREYALFESGLRWLKASNDTIVFINIEGESFILAEDEIASQRQLELCLNDLHDKTLDVAELPHENKNFFTFKGTKSYLWSDGKHLFAKLQSNKELYCLV